MKRSSKKMVWLMISLVAASILIGIATLYILIKPEKLLPKIAYLVQEKTGYITTTKGAINLSLYPLLAIDIEELSITKPNQTQPMVTLKNVSLSSPWQFNWTQPSRWQTTIRAKTLLFKQIKATNAKTELTSENGTLKLNQLTADFYQGKITAEIQFSKQPTPIWQWQTNLTQIDTESLLQDLRGESAQFTIVGKANAHLTGSAEHLDERDFQHATTGTLQLEMTAGSLNGIDLNYFIDKGIALLKHEKSNKNKTDRTEFKKINGIIYFAEGVAKTSDLTLQTNTFSAHVIGDLSFADQTLDLSLQVTPNSETRLTVPLLITGSIRKPTVALDALLIQTMLTKEEMEQIKTKVEKEIKKLPERANKIMEQLFGQ